VDTKAFDTLEQKVSQVLEKLDHLRSENDDLRQQVQEWEARYKELSDQIEGLTRERDKLVENQRDETKEERIRQKVVELLARLEAA
jgi:predicted nuclease with TOPRIM domain